MKPLQIRTNTNCNGIGNHYISLPIHICNGNL